MIKCPNCGAENSDSAMFCENCGTKIPHEKECPVCHEKVKLAAKFCAGCGYNFNSGKKNSSCGGFSVGDKNVIAGDVIGNQETFKIEGAATIVQNEDETKKMVTCHVCGHNITILQSIKCPVCHETVCEECFQADRKMCTRCISKIDSDREEVYIQSLRKALEDNKITLEERQELNALQKQLGIPSARSFELEKLIKNGVLEEKNKSVLSDYIQQSFNKALDLLYDKGDISGAYEKLKTIYLRYPQNEEVITSFLFAAIKINPEEAIQIIQQNRADIVGFQLVCLDYELLNHDLNAADERVNAAIQLWPDNLLLNCRRIMCLKAMYDELNNESFLQQAADILATLARPQNKLESSWYYKAQYTISLALGDELPELTKEYCREHDIYYALSQPEVSPDESSGKDSDVSETAGKAKPQVVPQDEYTRFLAMSAEERASLESIQLPEELTVIGESAFAGCVSLKKIIIPQGVKNIEKEAFKDCSSLESVQLPEGLENIGAGAFECCCSLKEIVIPASVKTIGEYAFCCITEEAGGRGTSLRAVHLSEGLVSIDHDAFNGCTELKNITIPASVRTIAASAFIGCLTLESVHFLGKPLCIGDGIFEYCDELHTIFIQEGFDKTILTDVLKHQKVNIMECKASPANQKVKKSAEKTADREAFSDDVILPVIQEFFKTPYRIDDLFINPKIPASKEKNLRNTAKIPDDAVIYALVDNTVFGSAKNGLAFTSKGLYWHNDWTASKTGSYTCSWQDFCCSSEEPHICTDDKLEVCINSRHLINCAGGIDRQFLVKLLLDLKQKLKQSVPGNCTSVQ